MADRELSRTLAKPSPEHACGVARPGLAGRSDQDHALGPASHASFGELSVVVGQDGVDPDAALEANLGGLECAEGIFQLRCGGHEGVPILQCPAVVLGVRDLDAIGPEFFEEQEHLLEMIEIAAVHDQVGREGDFVLTDPAGEFDFVEVRLRSGDVVCTVWLRILKTDLDVIEPTAYEAGEAVAIQSES